jgi:hypothetical protein
MAGLSSAGGFLSTDARRVLLAGPDCSVADLWLLEWAVDGITTDYPDQLAQFLDQRGIAY